MKLEELRQLTDEQLIERFPFIKNRDRFSGEETEGIELCRNWGWYNLELLVCEHIKRSYDKWTEETKNQFMILDIKEKYGTLRFYTTFTDDEIHRAINDATNLSFCMCYQCGKIEKDESGKNAITYKKRVYGGEIALCKECAEKARKEYNSKTVKVLEPFEYETTCYNGNNQKPITKTFNSLELFDV